MRTPASIAKHPIHPMLVNFPIGLWFFSLICDLIGVRAIAVQQGKPIGVPEPVVTGFHSDDQKHLYRAPVGLVQDMEGALIVADEWRIYSWL